MQIIIESSYKIRNKDYSSYHKFAEYSNDIESTLTRHLDFLIRNGGPYKLTFTVKED